MKKFFLLLIAIVTITTILSAQNTYVPDDNFEQALIDLGYDSGPLDDYVPTANISGVTELLVAGKNIGDLTGIEDFSSLETLHCWNNNLSSLDLLSNSNISYVRAGQNQISSIDISNLTDLFFLDLDDNALTDITFLNNYLWELYCLNNQLTSIDLSSSGPLRHFECSNNQLSSLSLAGKSSLTRLLCDNNQITDLNLSFCTSLVNLKCDNNQLASLNIKNGNNNNLTSFNATNNPSLTCIEVDNATYMDANWSTGKDATARYSNDCSVSVPMSDWALYLGIFLIIGFMLFKMIRR